MLKQGLIALLGTATCSLIVNHAPVQAYSLNPDVACQLTDVTGASNCKGSYTLGNGENDVTNGDSSNIATQLLNNSDVFGVGGGWSFDSKKDDGGISGDNSLNVSLAGLGGTSGKFDVSNIDFDTTEIAISLKASKGFSLYHITKDSLNGLTEIDWSTFGTSRTKPNKNNPTGQAQGLSHASIYYRFTSPVSPQTQDVPEPASGLALLAIGAVAAKKFVKKGDA